MTSEEFLAWYERQENGQRDELCDGVVYPREMPAERATHARAKSVIARQFADAMSERSLPYESFTNGMAVRIDGGTFYDPTRSCVAGRGCRTTRLSSTIR